MLRDVVFAVLLAAPASAGDFVRFDGRVIDPTTGAGLASAHVVIAQVGRASILYPTADDMMAVTPGEAPNIAAHSSGDVRTDDKGRFHFDELAPGQYSIVAAHAVRGVAFLALELPGSNASEVVLKLEPPRTVELRLRGLAFDPSKHVLEFKPRTAPLHSLMIVPRLKLGDGWNFETVPLPALDDWIVNGSELVLENDYRATRFTLFLHLDKPGAHSFDIDLRGGSELSGVVRGPDREPLAGASVLARNDGRPIVELGAVTDERGRYTIRGCEPGTYELSVARWRMRDAPGCGQGPADALATRSIRLPLEDASLANIDVEKFELALAVGSAAPDFTAKQLDGTKLTLSDLRGKVVLLDFWATWCGLCRADLPDLERFYPERAKSGAFEIVSVSIDDDAPTVERFLKARKMPWRHVALGPVKSNPIAKLYNVWGTPATVVIDRDGKIAARNLLGAELRKKIDELLAAK